MKEEKIIIDGLPIITKRGNFMSCQLEIYQMSRNQSVSELADILKKISELGFNDFDIEYETGYYDSVENIFISFCQKVK